MDQRSAYPPSSYPKRSGTKATHAPKAKKAKQSLFDDPAFAHGYRAAHATIYDRNDYAGAIEQLKALGHDDNAGVANPFDQEVQSITEPFAALLRSIVVTVDAHGLKHRRLKRHARAVVAFFDALADRNYESDASKALQEVYSATGSVCSHSCNMMACRGTTILPKTRSSASAITGKMSDEASEKPGLPSTWYC
jgi:hypothetical protein